MFGKLRHLFRLYMSSVPIRILLAEDYLPFRLFLSSTLQGRPEWQVICEVADGREAIQKAEQLQPDLVLLDIGLPTLNGIDAATRIRAVCPTSKILFVSQESSKDIVEAAIDTGAHGYLSKSDAGTELLTAVEAILLGRRYFSRSIAGGMKASSLPSLVEARIPTPARLPLRDKKSRHHEVGFYADDRSAWDGRINFIAAALKNGNAAVVIASASHQNEFLSRLQASGIEVSAAIGKGRYFSQDVGDALHALMVNDLPDPDKFSTLAGELIERAGNSVDGNASRVFVCGEGTTLLWEQGNEEAVVRLERLWDEIAKVSGIHVHCGYLSSSFRTEIGKAAFHRICAEHSGILSL